LRIIKSTFPSQEASNIEYITRTQCPAPTLRHIINVEQTSATILIRNGEEKLSATASCRTADDRNTLSPSPWGMRTKKPTISQKSGGKDKLPPPPDQDPTQRHQKHCATTSPTSPPSEPACGFLIRRRSESVVGEVSFTIDVDVWRATPSCHPTRSGGGGTMGATSLGKAQARPPAVPHHHKSPLQICPTKERERWRLCLGCTSTTNAALPTTSLCTTVHLAFTSTPLATDGRPNANPRRIDKIKLEVTRRQGPEQPTEEIGGPKLGRLEPAAIGSDHQIPASVIENHTSLHGEEDEDPATVVLARRTPRLHLHPVGCRWETKC
jgi:hypothetical protein